LARVARARTRAAALAAAAAAMAQASAVATGVYRQADGSNDCLLTCSERSGDSGASSAPVPSASTSCVHHSEGGGTDQFEQLASSYRAIYGKLCLAGCTQMNPGGGSRTQLLRGLYNLGNELLLQQVKNNGSGAGNHGSTGGLIRSGACSHTAMGQRASCDGVDVGYR
jgi:hypothetical protein